jgi:phage major head subunit gpT-like protein
MPLPTPARLTTSRAVIGQFYLALQQDEGASWISRISQLFSSDQESETYAWLGQVPQLREWVGGRQAKGLSEFEYTIRNRKYESTLEILRDWLERDKTGQLMMRIREQAARANAHWAKLLSDLIIAGESTACYDGQYFFDTDHAESGASQSNDIGSDIATATAPTSVEMAEAILLATQQILGIKDDQAELMNENARRFLVMVPLPYMAASAAALGSTVIADTVSRTNTIMTLGTLGGFQYELAINPRLSWTTKFALFRADEVAAPLIRQEETPIQMSAQAEGSPVEFERDTHQYGIRAKRAVGYGMWQHACLVTFS